MQTRKQRFNLISLFYFILIQPKLRVAGAKTVWVNVGVFKSLLKKLFLLVCVCVNSLATGCFCNEKVLV